jgi:3-oxocholest-4-en-26-oyl-CoA dehydrogenase beta subunit
MDFGLEWHQSELQSAARGFLAAAAGHDTLRALEATDLGYSRATYRELGELGWLELGIGADDEDLIDLVLLYEELGRSALPGPHFMSTVVGGRLLARLGSPAQSELVGALGDGSHVLAVALHEESAGYDAASISLRAGERDGQITLDGRKLFVPYAVGADSILVLARTGEEAQSLTWYLVPAGAPGVTVTPLAAMSNDRLCEVVFDGVLLPAEAQVGERDGAWSSFESVLPRANVIQAAELVGLCDAAFEQALEYAKVRVAFGRPIGAFQAIQHKIADMVADRDGARFLVYQAACLINDGRESEAPVAMAKAFGARAARRVTKEAHQIYAGHGFVLENPLNYYYRRAKVIELSLGDVNEQLDRVALQMGL